MSSKMRDKQTRRLFIEYTEAIITALLLALIIRAFFVQAFKIPSGSMIPTLLIGDHILVNKFVYGIKLPFSDEKYLAISEPHNGDIVVFKYPQDPERDFIKRIIGIGGDVIESKDKTIFVNGKKLDEPYAKHTDDAVKPRDVDPRDNFGPIVVPKGKYFMMGDNRDQSYDSRFWGFVDVSAIKGKSMILYWSWDGIKKFPRFDRIGKLVN